MAWPLEALHQHGMAIALPSAHPAAAAPSARRGHSMAPKGVDGEYTAQSSQSACAKDSPVNVHCSIQRCICSPLPPIRRRRGGRLAGDCVAVAAEVGGGGVGCNGGHGVPGMLAHPASREFVSPLDLRPINIAPRQQRELIDLSRDFRHCIRGADGLSLRAARMFAAVSGGVGRSIEEAGGERVGSG